MWLKQCHVIVAEVTQPSLGVGYELGRGVEMKKKILCMYRPQPDKSMMQTTTGSTHLPRSPASSCRSSVISRSAAASSHVGSSLRAGGRSLRKESTGRRTFLAPMSQSTKASASSQYLEMVPCRVANAPTNGSTVYKNGAV
ncbi:uncharacterized protein LOC143029051 [Oratosquilla oratoria]|uniref:uncharacterized protein LOC143029051 n=1 Tax=Oratosquilla oratoria TaxID=337810 RepID=UPI003F75E6C0